MDHNIKRLLIKKARKSSCNYKIGAIAISHKGEIIGRSFNTPPISGNAYHAEQILMARYGKNIKTIIIVRVNKTGGILPISPCDACKEMAEKYNIDIVSFMPEDEK